MKTTETLMHSCAAEFLVGDVVVVIDEKFGDELLTVVKVVGAPLFLTPCVFATTPNGRSELFGAELLRHAEIAELQAKRRLGVSHE